MFDVNAKTSGDVTSQFKDYDVAANRDLIDRAFSGTDFLKNTPSLVRGALATYPDSYICVAPTKTTAVAAYWLVPLMELWWG